MNSPEKLNDEIIKLCNESKDISEVDIAKIKKAIKFATKYHHNQLRKSGEPYIIHPLSVAKILLLWEMDVETICAGILHDVVEDTPATLELINRDFGEQVEKLVDAVTKVSTYSNQNRANQSNKTDNINEYETDDSTMSVVKVFLGMSKDIRVILIKIADRLHNMRTIHYLKQDKQIRIAQETKDIYANIAGRLGMYEVKTELDDICMRILEPQEYRKIKTFLEKNIKKYNNSFNEAIDKINLCLTSNHIDTKLKSRIKSISSINEKLKANENLNDLFAVRIIVDKILDCYLVLGIIHSNFYNLQNSFKDFISTPKINLYQSLHTIVIYKGLNIEIQIRTKDMDALANFGIAAHWKYKDKQEMFDSNFDSISNMLVGIDNENKANSISLIKKIARQKFINILDKNKMVWKSIPEDTCLLDYAYITNSSKFDYIKEFIVNSQLENMYYVIQPGDSIEIIYSSNKTINKQWEHISHDSTVKKYIADQMQKIKSNLEHSTDEFVENIIKNGGSRITKTYILEFIKKNFNINSIKEFLDSMRAIDVTHSDINKLFGNNKSERKQMITKIKSLSWKWLIAKSLFQSNDTSIFFNEINITECCSKIPPLDIVGCIQSNSLNVHRFNCPHINEKAKLIVLKWDKDKIKKSSRSFKAKIKFTGNFSPECSTAIIQTIMRYKGAISKFDLKKDKTNKEFIIDSEIYVKNYSNLEKMASDLQNKGLIYSWKLI